MKRGIVLFAHGSRDAAWARPFEEIAAQVRQQQPGAEVVLAYLEIMTPSLAEALRALAATQIRAIQIFPLFLGMGGHVRNDLPQLVSQARVAHPELHIQLEKPLGEERAFIEAAATIISKRDGRSSR